MRGKNFAEVQIDTDDNKALIDVLGLIEPKAKSDKALASFLKPYHRQLVSLQRRVQNALLDLDTDLGDGS